MAGEGQAMTSERLAEIRQQVDEYARKVYKKSDVMFGYGLHELLAEVERLRAREAAQLAVVRAVASAFSLRSVIAVGRTEPHVRAVLPRRAIEQARALLASTGEAGEQAAQGEELAAMADESEQEGGGDGG